MITSQFVSKSVNLQFLKCVAQTARTTLAADDRRLLGIGHKVGEHIAISYGLNLGSRAAIAFYIWLLSVKFEVAIVLSGSTALILAAMILRSCGRALRDTNGHHRPRYMQTSASMQAPSDGG